MNNGIVNIETVITEYETRRHIYADFAATIERILQLLLKKSHVRYQKTESRAKDVGRLRKKLAKTENVGKGLYDITDLSGCRVIFHLEEDVSNFAQILEGILKTSEEDQDTGEMQEAEVVLDPVLVAHRDSPELCEPGEQSFDLPASLIAA